MAEKLSREKKDMMLIKWLGLPEGSSVERVAEELKAVTVAHQEISIAKSAQQPIEMTGWRKTLNEMKELDSHMFWYLIWEYIYSHDLEDLKM